VLSMSTKVWPTNSVDRKAFKNYQFSILGFLFDSRKLNRTFIVFSLFSGFLSCLEMYFSQRTFKIT
jgi:hypothetical protein